MSAGATGDRALMGYERWSDERSSDHEVLGVVSPGYIYRSFPMSFLCVFNLLNKLPIDLVLVAAQQLSLVTRPD